MTGIERLRELVDGISPITVVCGVTRTSYDREHMEVAGKRLRDFLADIANQIEREQGERVSRVRILAVVTKMERHVLGHEGMEDSPVARWARELREALAGHEYEEVTDVATVHKDAYDAYEWVFEHGGLDAVKRDAACWNTAENIAQTTLGWLARVCPVAGIEKCGYGVALEKLEDAINRRLMPEGMEWLLEVWPKWSNGEYCKFGDWWKSDMYGEPNSIQFRKLSIYTPEQLREWEQDEGDNFGYEWDFMRPSDTTYRPDKAEPPAPKVLDADGVEIRAGDEVWNIDTGMKLTVTALPEREGYSSVELTDSAGTFFGYDPNRLTHRAPVLAADGLPLREGETVYEVDGTGHSYKVVGIRIGDSDPLTPTVVTCDVGDGTSEHFLPSQLTHERPESWERLEEDAGKNPFDYCKDVGHRLDTCENSEAYKARDLVRRAKALAERDA
ncbi:hypothetical protein [Thermophilibacter provencensis]|uniref:hypothetical protein n=1 Tax=Thermophilibacter provencensis TaxID=1852386 RepID=UPI00294398BB|nr:hypothetical protein [Thermophilibacter provencensis]